MPDANALNRAQLVTAILGRRFPTATQAPNALRWLAAAYSDVWQAGDWKFKRVSLANLAVTAGSRTPTMPTDFEDAYLVVDQYGDELERMPQEQFEARFAGDFALSVTGAPCAYTVVNNQVILGTTPGVTATFLMSYRRRLSHLQSDQVTVQPGFMDADTDYPLWTDHHGVLIPRAVAIGLQELNDPTWMEPQQEYERQLSRMQAQHEVLKVGAGQRAGGRQWGRN